MVESVLHELARFPFEMGSGRLYAGSPSQEDSFEQEGFCLSGAEPLQATFIVQQSPNSSYMPLVAIFAASSDVLANLQSSILDILTPDLVILGRFKPLYQYVGVGDLDEAKCFRAAKSDEYMPEVMELALKLLPNSPSPQVIGCDGQRVIACVGEDYDEYLVMGRPADSGFDLIAVIPDILGVDLGYVAVEDIVGAQWYARQEPGQADPTQPPSISGIPASLRRPGQQDQ